MQAVLATFSALLSISYPLWVWLMLTHQRGAAWFAMILLLIGGLRLLLSTLSKLPSRFFPRWWSPVLNLAMMALGLWVLLSGEGRAFQVYPLIVSATLLAVFGGSLLTQKSMIERFAEVYEKNITPTKKAYMQRVTLCWCGFFVFNFAVSAYTWAAMSLVAWTWYNGVLSYILIGLLFVGEYAYRKLIFLKKYE